MEETFTDFLLYGCKLGEKMGSQLDSVRPPYWVRCISTVSFMLNKKISQDYEKNNTPENERFLKLKEKFLTLYQAYEEDFSKPFITINPNKTKTINDHWLRFDGEADLNDYECYNENVQNTTLDVVNKTNRGLCIVIAPRTDDEPCDREFPLSEMFHTGIFIRSVKKTEINYPMCVLYFIYGCIYYAVPDCHPQVKIELDKIREYSQIKPKKLTDQFKNPNKRIQKMLNKNSDFIATVTRTVEKEIENIKDDQIFDISESTKSGLEMLDRGNGDIFEMIKSFMPNSDTESADNALEMMGLGTSQQDIKNLVDFVTSDELVEDDSSFEQILRKINK